MKFINLNGIDYQLPENWADLTWGQYKAIQEIEETDDQDEFILRGLAALTGISVEEWLKFDDVSMFTEYGGTVLSLFSTIPEDVAFGFEFTHEGEKFRLPDKLEFTNVGQYQDCLAAARSIMPKESSEDEEAEQPKPGLVLEAYERITKMYIQPIVQGSKYDAREAMKLNIDGLRYADVTGWGAFFFVKAIESNGNTQRIVLHSITQKKRGKPSITN